jgi:hypothetical protein
MGLMRFWKVFYPVETQEKIVRSAIDYYPRFQPQAASTEWAHWTAEAIRFFIPTFKNDDFIEEKEWRLIFSPAAGGAAKPSYRVARGMLIPYFSLRELSKQLGHGDPKLPLTSIRISPCVANSTPPAQGCCWSDKVKPFRWGHRRRHCRDNHASKRRSSARLTRELNAGGAAGWGRRDAHRDSARQNRQCGEQSGNGVCGFAVSSNGCQFHGAGLPDPPFFARR